MIREPRRLRECPLCGRTFVYWLAHLKSHEKKKGEEDRQEGRCDDCHKRLVDPFAGVYFYDQIVGAARRVCEKCWDKRLHPPSEVTPFIIAGLY